MIRHSTAPDGRRRGGPGEMSRGGADFDVIVAGGGMIGSVAALALAPLGLRIAMVEAVARGNVDQPSFDERSTVLSRSSQRLFSALGLWGAIASSSAPIGYVHVSDKGRFGFAHIDAAEQNVEALGHVAINRVLGEVLRSAIAATANIREFCPARIVAVERLADRDAERIVTRISTGDGKDADLSAALLVVADGAASSVRDLLGIGATHQSYGQYAVIGNLRTERPIGSTAYERFTARGPLALLPVPGDRAAFVWTLDERDADSMLALDDDLFLEQLQGEFGLRLGTFAKVGVRAAYPLSLSKALRLTAARAVLVGNAAHGLHPVAAQGFNLGLRDVAALADCVADVIAAEGASPAIGNAAVLERYANWRRADQRKLVALTDGLVRLFGSRRRAVRHLRDLGMLAFDIVPGARREFARHTMGLTGRLPRLSRGVALR